MTLFLEESYSSVVRYTLYNLVSNLVISTGEILKTEQVLEIPVSQKLRPKNKDLVFEIQRGDRSFFFRIKRVLSFTF